MDTTTKLAAERARDRRERRVELQALVQEQLMTRWRATVGWLLIVAGAVAVLAAWYQVRDLPDVALQIPYLVSGGLGGALFMALGGALLLSQDFRDDKETIRDLAIKVEELEEIIVEQAEIVGEAVAILSAASSGLSNGTKSRSATKAGSRR